MNTQQTVKEMLNLLLQNQGNPQQFAELIQQFSEYFSNVAVGGGIEDKIKQAEDNWQPKGI